MLSVLGLGLSSGVSVLQLNLSFRVGRRFGMLCRCTVLGCPGVGVQGGCRGVAV